MVGIWLCIIQDVTDPNLFYLPASLTPDLAVNLGVNLARVSNQNELSVRKPIHERSDLFNLMIKSIIQRVDREALEVHRTDGDTLKVLSGLAVQNILWKEFQMFHVRSFLWP